MSDVEVKHRNYFGRTRSEMLPFIPVRSTRILDVGCADGSFSRQLKENREAEVWGIELNEKMAMRARDCLDNVLVGDIGEVLTKLPINYFDCIIFNDVLEHLVDPYNVLRKIKSNLADDGSVVSSIPNIRYYYALREVLIEKQWRYRDYGIFDRTHVRFFTQASIVDMFDSSGFDILQIQGINAFKSWKFSLLNRLLFGHLSDMRFEQFACVAKPRRQLESTSNTE